MELSSIARAVYVLNLWAVFLSSFVFNVEDLAVNQRSLKSWILMWSEEGQAIRKYIAKVIKIEHFHEEKQSWKQETEKAITIFHWLLNDSESAIPTDRLRKWVDKSSCKY